MARPHSGFPTQWGGPAEAPRTAVGPTQTAAPRNVCSTFGRKWAGEERRRKGAVRDSGEAQKQGAETERQTDIQTRQWTTGGGGQLAERRRKEAGNKGSSCNPASLPPDRAGLSGCSPPCSLGLARSLGPTEECQRAKAPEQMRV